LLTVGGGLFLFLGYKTKADVQAAVDVQFRATVQETLNKRVEQAIDEINGLTIEARRKLEGLVSAQAAAEGLVEGIDPQQAEPDQEGTPVPSLDGQEQEILKLMVQSKYSFRSLIGVGQEAQKKGISSGRAAECLESLMKKGLIGKTLGKKGAERWYVTTEGRQYPLS